MAQPHFVRFAQALALVTGLTGCNTTPAPTLFDAATNDVSDPAPDAAPSIDAAPIADAAPSIDAAPAIDAYAAPDAALSCSTCAVCTGDPGPPCPLSLGCECGIVGPLSPPDLLV